MTKKDSVVLKGIAILGLIFYHLFYNVDITELSMHSGLLFSADKTQFLARACHFFLPVFVFLTGYGLSCVEKESEGARDSLKNGFARYLRFAADQSYILLVVLAITYIGGFERTASAVWGGSLFQKMLGVSLNGLGLAGRLDVEWFSSSWWYVGLAVFWIFLVPPLYRLIKKMGPYTSIALGILLPEAIGLNVTNDTVGRYFPALVCGIVWAAFSVDRKIVKVCEKDRRIKYLLTGFLIFSMAFYVLFRNRIGSAYLSETGMAVVLIVLYQLHGSKLSILNDILALFGRNSKYMWLLHAFIISYWFKDRIYSIKNMWLLFGVTVLSTLIFSIVLKKVKVVLKRDNIAKANISAERPGALALIITILDYAVVVISMRMAYLTNDDGSIQNALSGFTTGEPYPFHQFVNAFLTYPLSGLYRLFPTVNWWYVWSQLLMVIGIFLVHYVILKLSQKYQFPFWITVGVICFIDAGFFLYPVANISFTIVPAVLGSGIMAVLFHLEDISSEKKRKVFVICAVIAYIALLFHRKQTGLVILCYLLMAFLYYYFKEGFQWKRSICKFFLTAGVFAIITLFFTNVSSMILNQENGEEFAAFNSARSQYMDFPHASYEENPEIYSDVGWDSDTYDLVGSWFFLDEDINTETFTYLSEQSEEAPEQKTELVKEIFSSSACRPIFLLWGASVLFVLYGLIMHFDIRTGVFMIFNMIGSAILLLYQIFEGRILYRTVIIVLLPAVLFNVLLGIKNSCRDYPFLLKWMMIILALCCSVPVLEYTFDASYKESVQAHQERAETITDYMQRNPDHFYVTEVGMVSNINPFYKPQGYSNNISWGGSTYYSGEYYDKLEKNGISKLTGETFKEENVFFMSSENVLRDDDMNNPASKFLKFFSWLKKEYGAIGFVLEDTVLDGAYVYHFVFEDDLENYDRFYDIVNGNLIEIN